MMSRLFGNHFRKSVCVTVYNGTMIQLGFILIIILVVLVEASNHAARSEMLWIQLSRSGMIQNVLRRI